MCFGSYIFFAPSLSMAFMYNNDLKEQNQNIFKYCATIFSFSFSKQVLKLLVIVPNGIFD